MNDLEQRQLKICIQKAIWPKILRIYDDKKSIYYLKETYINPKHQLNKAIYTGKNQKIFTLKISTIKNVKKIVSI